MSTELAAAPHNDIATAQAIEQVLLHGDIGKLTPQQRTAYYNRVCTSLGLNPLTQPFEFMTLNGKVRFYATKSCTEQLRTIHGVSITVASREVSEGCYVVVAKATNAQGRTDESIGAVPIDNKKGEERSNAMMKAETKAKRRVTLSICGLGMLDESEVDSVPSIEVKPFNDHPLPLPPKDQKFTTDEKTGEVIPIKMSKKRSSLLMKAHIIKQKLGISDETWKGRLAKRYAGIDSCAGLSDAQLADLVAALEARERQHAEARAGQAQMAAEVLGEKTPAPVSAPEVPSEPMMTDLQRGLIVANCTPLNMDISDALQLINRTYLTEVTESEAADLIDRMGQMITTRTAQESK